MYNRCHLVHSDLSAFNLLWHSGRVHFIDVSQSVEPTHPHGLEFLLRDCTNITTFFRKKGMEGVPSPRQLFCDIAGLTNAVDNDEELLVQVSAGERRGGSWDGTLLCPLHLNFLPFPTGQELPEGAAGDGACQGEPGGLRVRLLLRTVGSGGRRPVRGFRQRIELVL